MLIGNTFQYRMGDLAIFFNHAKMNIFEKTGEIIPGWFLGIHAVGQYGKFFNLFLSHIFSDITFHQADDH